MINKFDKTLLKMHARSSCLFIISLALKETKINALQTLTEFCHYTAFLKKILLRNFSLNYKKSLR